MKTNPFKYIEPKIIPTQDGSSTLFVNELNETYHSTHGALQESMHVFIKEGLEFIANEGLKEIKIFEMGFGTGLNAFLAYVFSIEGPDLKIEYHSIEKYPVNPSVLADLGYDKLESLNPFKKQFIQVLDSEWNQTVALSENFSLKKVYGDFFEFEIEKKFYDLIFYDAFGARAQEEMWNSLSFRICSEIIRENGYLVTYASKGSARRALLEVGFEVDKIPGPPGKREMMRAQYISK